ncbi:MAG TPA: sigma-70 family RNA polymerase sigma factor [Puia sp.]|nr:sigma-70 family RNA polymerase sigma factor [Puia sp.]
MSTVNLPTPILTFLTTISSNGNGIDPTDLELVAAYRHSRDLKVLAQLYQKYLDLLFGVCLKYLEDRELAKDAVMDIFEELAAKLPRHDITNFKGWLYTLARNHCLMQLRSSSRFKVSSFDPELMQTADERHLNDKMEKEARLDKLSDCIETLSADQKTVVTLFYLENKCYKEIETITGYDWNKVRSLIQNGRRNLRLCMQQHETHPTPAGETK